MEDSDQVLLQTPHSFPAFSLIDTPSTSFSHDDVMEEAANKLDDVIEMHLINLAYVDPEYDTNIV